MNTVLNCLGVPVAVQQLFSAGELIFPYGDHVEHFEMGFHRVPTTPNLWLAGRDWSPNVIITSTAMEAIAYVTLNSHRYTALDSLSFAAIGNLPHPGQIEFIRKIYRRNKFTLVFSNDLLGRLTDVKMAAGLRGLTVHLAITGDNIRVSCANRNYHVAADQFSLSRFEKSAGIRTAIRTAKPKLFDTFLDQLRHDANQ